MTPYYIYMAKKKKNYASKTLDTLQDFFFLILLLALVNLVKEDLKDFTLETSGLIDLSNSGSKVSSNLLLIVQKVLSNVELGKDSLDLSLGLGVLDTVVLVKNLALLSVGLLKGLVDDPAALVILDVGTDLANDSGVTVAVEVVILNLEVLTKRKEDVFSLLEVLGRVNASHVHGKSNRKVEGVESSLVSDNVRMLLKRKLGKVNFIFRGSEKIKKLTKLSLEGNLVEEFNKINVVGLLLEVVFKKNVNGSLEHKSVVDGNHTNLGGLVPARLTSTGDGAVHDIVSYQKVGLQKLDTPSKEGSLLVLFFGEFIERLVLKKSVGVNNRETSVSLAADTVVDQTLQKKKNNAC